MASANDQAGVSNADLDSGSSEAGLAPLSRLVLGGHFAEQVTAIPQSLSSLILATGFLEESQKPVLIPFVEMMFAGVRQGDVPDGEEPPKLDPIFSRTLSLENALWLSFDVLRDIRLSCARLRRLIEGDLTFDPARIAHARHFADKARMEAEMCALLLEELCPAARSKGEGPFEVTSTPASAEVKRGPPVTKRRLKRPQKKT